MNHLEYLGMLLEQDDKLGRWATVKNIKIGTVSLPDPASTYGAGLHFKQWQAQYIGKRLLFHPYNDEPDAVWWTPKPPEQFLWYHKDWLIFDDEEQPNLFTRDPKPTRIHWHSAGRE